MANPNNLIRPPVLNTPNPNPIPNPSVEPHNSRMNTELENRISLICEQQCRNIVQSIINPNADINYGNDQTIEERYRENLHDLDKIPDIVRSLREFSGNPSEFNSWKKSVDRVLQIYDSMKGTPKYYGILSVIRNKVIGNADIALESYNTPLDWNSIVRCLTLHYADKRDLGTLEYQMTSLIQGKNTTQIFYQQVYSHLSLILNKIGCMEMGQESLRLLTQTYRDKALDTFIRGLNGDLPRLLGIREPSDLPQALHLCLKLENQHYRSEYANKHQNYKHRQQPSPSPMRNLNTQNYNRPFYPELTFQNPTRYNTPMNSMQQNTFKNQQPFPYHNPQQTFQPHHQMRQQFQFQPSRPTEPKPQRSEPMEIDQSVQTRNINYQNRPRQTMQFQGKRPASMNHVPPPFKQQRNFHIQTEQQNFDNIMENEEFQPENYEANYYQQLQNEDIGKYVDSLNQQDKQYEIPTQDLTDIHFLG